MAFTFNPFTGSFDAVPSTLRGDNAYTTVNANSASWAIDSTTDTGVRALTANWQNTYTTVSSNSANWESVYTSVKQVSSNWDSSYTTTQTNSANWQTTYTASSAYVTSDITGIANATALTNMIQITLDGYNALGASINANTVYIIVG